MGSNPTATASQGLPTTIGAEPTGVGRSRPRPCDPGVGGGSFHVECGSPRAPTGPPRRGILAPVTLVVRLAAAADAAGIAAVHVASWQRAYAGLVPQDHLDSLSVPDRTRTWEQNLSRPAAPGLVTLVAELDGHAIGFASVGPSRDDDADPPTRELWGFYLHPSHWGAGHGHAVHAHVLARWRADLGASDAAATLWVLAANTRARRFYERHGWAADGAEKTDWRGTVRLDEVRYRRTLSAHPGA